MRLKLIISPCVLCIAMLFISGCGNNPNNNSVKTEMQDSIKAQINKDLQKEAPGVVATEVTLVHESNRNNNKYIGLVELNNGEQFTLSVTVDGKDYIWEVVE